MPPPQATTLRRAKAQYKKSGSRPLSPTQQRKLARALELDRRAQAARDREKRRKQAEKARQDKEAKEREARKQLGIGLATQLAGYSLTQKQMKGGMESWLGVGDRKRKRDDEEINQKENRNTDGSDVNTEHESFSSNMSFDEALLDQLDDKVEHPLDRSDSPSGHASASHASQPGDISTNSDSKATAAAIKLQAPSCLPLQRTVTPPAKRVKTMRSPDDNWSQFLDGNTQILNEISQPPPRAASPVASLSLPPMSTQDLELTSDDLAEAGLPRTATPILNPKDGIIVRDFAYSNQASENNNSISVIKPPNAPSLPGKSRSERSILRSFSRGPTIATPSPKMTATYANFSAAQCSFTSDYHDFGLSTQLLQEAIEAGDDDTEDEDEEVYFQALEKSKVSDNVLMPPPPLRLNPTVYTPAVVPDEGQGSDLFSRKGGLQILGLSTQVLREAAGLDYDSGESTDEDEDDALFSIPLQRPSATKATTALSTVTTDVAKHTSGTNTSRFHDLGLSTQDLKAAAQDDVDFTDDEDTQGS
ncbi:uncharacterized protein PV09_00186 [Verruconis gallopava]|uniref:Uncharacterized protein n=1 Tax=Verruconis gallopava TaxID=253628 RepID=A0A0D2ARC8_9PEZI|nr:uncharacterized protein PV09_00186 [Verruconis gallopava]KIW09263.1 hypothetical protein PV09_00186 [Verruconis gallopava]